MDFLFKFLLVDHGDCDVDWEGSFERVFCHGNESADFVLYELGLAEERLCVGVVSDPLDEGDGSGDSSFVDAPEGVVSLHWVGVCEELVFVHEDVIEQDPGLSGVLIDVVLGVVSHEDRGLVSCRPLKGLSMQGDRRVSVEEIMLVIILVVILPWEADCCVPVGEHDQE